MVMGVDFGVIWAAEFDNIIRFEVRRPARRPRVTRRPPSHQNSKEMTDIWLWVSIFRLFGPLNSIMSLDFRSAAPPAVQRSPAAAVKPKFKGNDRYIVMGVDFWVYWAADSENAVRY